jgi:hypothetical protein
MQPASPSSANLSPEAVAFYRAALAALIDRKADFLVGGAYALGHYTGIVRDTKDFDIFVRPEDSKHVLQILSAVGCRTELTFPHWLGKAYCGEYFVDVIFSSGNGVCRVDDGWFAHAVQADLLGFPIRLCPPEELIWSKGFVQERERFDGADIAHLLRACGPHLDWPRLVRRFGPHWRVLLGHLIAFGFIYPGERATVPDQVLEGLWRNTKEEMATPPAAEKVCRGTLLSREQYLIDIEKWGYSDARLAPSGTMSPAAVEQWTEAIESGK